MFRRVVAPGIEIRHFGVGDAEAAFAVVERNCAHLREWLPRVDGSRSPEDVRAFIRRALVQTEEGRGPQAAIWIEGANEAEGFREICTVQHLSLVVNGTVFGRYRPLPRTQV